MPTSVKKSTTKAAPKANGAAHKSRVSAHPPWVDMIKECIIAHPEDARGGVSRPTIKKFVEDKYRIALDHAAAGQLNRAITSGSEKGTFVLPKGPSGKVKLAPKARTDAAKENAKPVLKKPASTKTAVATKAPAPKAKSVAARKAPPARSLAKAKAAKPAATATAAKPARKAATATAKTAVARKPSATVKKATTAKKGTTKKITAKKAVTSPRKAATAKARGAKAKPASKAKLASKTTAAKKATSRKA